jgi:predicted transglutaminase-like cysteine proteinase
VRRLAVAAAVSTLAAALVWHQPPVRALDVQRLRAAASALGPRAEAGARDLLALLGRIASADPLTQAREVNDFYNGRILYATDRAVWKEDEYWASPLQTLDKGRGDCDDYVIAKYFTLVAAGIPHERLQMAYVKIAVPPGVPEQPGDTSAAHMVLAYYPQPGAEPLILDNAVRQILPASQRRDLSEPTSYLNAVEARSGPDTRPRDPDRVFARWPNLKARAAAEGW